MNQNAVKSWLAKKKFSGFVQHEALGLLALGAGIVVLFLTFWFTYAVIWFGWQGVSAVAELAFSKKLHLSHEVRLVCSGVFLGLLFVQHFRTNPSYWGEYPDRDYVAAPALQMRSGIIGGLGFMLAYPGASANMIADILLSGPRLMTGAWQQTAQGFRLKRLDEQGCAELLTFLHSRADVVPYEELKSAGWEEWFGQLRRIEGVQFLQKGLMLTTELRAELGNLSGS